MRRNLPSLTTTYNSVYIYYFPVANQFTGPARGTWIWIHTNLTLTTYDISMLSSLSPFWNLRSYLLSRGPRWSLHNRHRSRGWDMLGLYVDKQWLLRNNYRGPRFNKYDLTSIINLIDTITTEFSISLQNKVNPKILWNMQFLLILHFLDRNNSHAALIQVAHDWN